MKKDGFIYIVLLILMAIIMITITYLTYLGNLQMQILSNTKKKTQSYYYAEGKLNKILYEEKYYDEEIYPWLCRNFRLSVTKADMKLNLMDRDMEEDNHREIKVEFYDNNKKKYLKLISSSDYQGIKTEVFTYGPLVRELYELGIPILSSRYLNGKELVDFYALLDDIKNNISINNCDLPSGIFGMEKINYSTVELVEKNFLRYDILPYRNGLELTKENCTKNQIFFILRNTINSPIELKIRSESRLDKIKLYGIIYIEGDIIVQSDLEFNGIIIIRNGIITLENEANLKVNGIILEDNNEFLLNFEDYIDMEYNRTRIYNFGTYLPGFLEPRFEVIKLNK